MEIALTNPVIQILLLRSWCCHLCGKHRSGLTYCYHCWTPMQNRL